MELHALRTPLIRPGDDLAALFGAFAMAEGDILVVTSKVLAMTEGAAVDISTLVPSEEALSWSAKTGRSAPFMEAVLHETRRLNGRIVGSCPGAVLTEVRPAGLPRGTIFTANAGMDESNVEKGVAVGWPHDPVMSAKRLREGLNRNCAVLVIDSCCVPRRLGVTAFCLSACGIDPLLSQIGRSDLHGRPLTITVEALGDQLATAAAMVMGNADQSTPAVIVRDHGFPFSDFCGWTAGIDPAHDLFRGALP